MVHVHYKIACMYIPKQLFLLLLPLLLGPLPGSSSLAVLLMFLNRTRTEKGVNQDTDRQGSQSGHGQRRESIRTRTEKGVNEDSDREGSQSGLGQRIRTRIGEGNQQ